MEFGERFVGLNKLTGRNYMEWRGVSQYVYTFPILKFVFERPDNGLIVVEQDSTIFYESVEFLLPLNKESEGILKDKLRNYYDQRIQRLAEKREIISRDLGMVKEKKEQLESQIVHLESLNEESYTDNRAVSIRQMSKAFRKKKHRLEAIETNINEKTKEMQEFEKEYQASLLYLEEQMEAML